LISKTFFLITGLFAAVTVFGKSAKTDSLLNFSLGEVTINRDRYAFYNEDVKVTHIDSLLAKQFRNDDLGQLLKAATPVFIKQYGGTGSLASISFRGGSSAQTQVRWNGFPLNSLTTGDIDLSLIPAGFMDDVSVTHGASGSLYGSGSFGGSVNMNNRPAWNELYSGRITSSYGSFGNHRYGIDASAGNKFFRYHASLSLMQSQNDFSYTDIYKAGSPEVQLQHGAVNEKGFMQNFYFKLPHKISIDAGLWLQGREKEVPALMGSYKKSNALQRDSAMRFYLQFQKLLTNASLTAKAGYFYNYLRYTDKLKPSDSLYYVNSMIKSGSFYADAVYRQYISNSFVLDGGVQFSHLSAKVAAYGKEPVEERMALLAGARYKKGSWTGILSLREELNSLHQNITLYSAGVHFEPVDNRMLIRLNVSNRFRLPTFNEKYWQPGGNTDLKPEKGNGMDLGVEGYLAGNKENKFYLKAEIAGYSYHVNDWIQWIPVASYVEARNFKKVWSRGVESSFTVFRRLSPYWWLKIQLGYEFTRTTNQEVYAFDEGQLNKQLIYVPEHTACLRLTADYKSLSGGIITNYSGITYTTADHSGNTLPAYENVDLFASYHLKLMKVDGTASVSIRNLFNNGYQVIKAYPMPGRSVMISFSLGLDKSL